MPTRVLPTDRIRDHIDELFAQGRPLPEILEKVVAVHKRNSLTDPHRHPVGISCGDHDVLPPESPGHLLHLDSRSRYHQPERYTSILPEMPGAP